MKLATKIEYHLFLNKMSVDIFGRTSLSRGGSNIVIQRGPPGIGFKYLDNDGNYDMDNKRLANVKAPVESNDAVTKTFIDTIIETKNIDDIRKLNELESSTQKKFSDVIVNIQDNKTQINRLKQLSGHIDMIRTNASILDDRLTEVNAKVDDYSILSNTIGHMDLKLQEIADVYTVKTADITSKIESISSELLGQSETIAGLAKDIIIYSHEVEQLKEYQSQSNEKLNQLVERVDLLVRSNIESNLGV